MVFKDTLLFRRHGEVFNAMHYINHHVIHMVEQINLLALNAAIKAA